MLITNSISSNLFRFTQILTQLREPDVAALRSLMIERPIEVANVAQFIAFSPETYHRNLIFDAPEHQVLVLCWRPGQFSPVHDHGRSCCGVRVLAGTATETVFPPNSNEPTLERELASGDVTVAPGTLRHRIANRGDADLITLHVYAPRLIVDAAGKAKPTSEIVTGSKPV